MTTSDLPGQADKETRGQGESFSPSPSLPFSLSPLLPLSLSPMHLALAYLAALAVAEVLTALIEPRVGLVLHGILLVILLLHTALIWEHPTNKLLLTLAFAPLIRLLSLCLPLPHLTLVYWTWEHPNRELLFTLAFGPLIRLFSPFLPLPGVPLVYWYFIISVPLFVATVIALRTLGFSWAGIGVNLRALPVQLLAGLTGLAFGYIEYQILEPEPLARAFTWEQLWVPALILLVSTGFVEEMIFRGVMQRAATEALGRIGVLYVAALFAVLHVGYKSLLDVLFVFGVALFFGWVVAKTHSILGVTFSHGLTNIVLFLVMPFLPLVNPPSTPLAPGTPLPPPAISMPAITALPTPTGRPTVILTATARPTATVTPTAPPTLPFTPTTTPSPSPTAVLPMPTPLPRAIVAVARLNVRAGPGTDYPVLTVVQVGQTYDIVGRNPAGDWWQICCVDGREGWVFGELATTRGELKRIPVATDIPPPPAAPSPTPSP